MTEYIVQRGINCRYVKRIFILNKLIEPEKKNEDKKPADTSKSYQIIHFNKAQIDKLTTGIQATLKHSEETVTPGGGKVYRIIKRTFDIVLSLFALIVLSPLFIGVMIAIIINDPGNPIFVQYRLTENGKKFPMFKFRSMYMDAEKRFEELQKQNETDGLAFKMKDDPRVTKIGKFIRKTSIDELPQLLNIIAGHMSIIGPRPPLPREVIYYTPYQMNRLMVKGGLACFCQCSGKSDMPFDEWVDSDIDYIKRRCLKIDLEILVKTFLSVIQAKNN